MTRLGYGGHYICTKCKHYSGIKDLFFNQQLWNEKVKTPEDFEYYCNNKTKFWYKEDDPSKLADCCKAFPDGIPVDILEKSNNHTEPYEGDKGYRYEEIKE